MQRTTKFTESSPVIPALKPSKSISLSTPQSAYLFRHRLSFYDEPPSPDTEVSLQDFERWALDRANILDALDKLILDRKNGVDLERGMRPFLNSKLPLSRSTDQNIHSVAIQAERFKDVMSHFILRLGACRSHDERERFLNLETKLFRLRYEMMPQEEQRAFVQQSNLPWVKASAEELAWLAEDSSHLYPSASSDGIVFKVPMEEATELLRQRKVVAKRGLVYVPETQQISLLSREFTARLSAGLHMLARHRGKFKDDHRIDPVLDLTSQFGAQQVQATGRAVDGTITADKLDQMVNENFLPLCASTLHQSLKATKHAYFDERRQYQTFLRNMGMPVDEAVRLYKRYYGNEGKMNEIEYSVLYTYGQKGSRKEHPPQSCDQIYRAGMSAQSNQAHGCPFQRLSAPKLEQLLRQHHIVAEAEIQDVQQLVKMRRFDLACSKVYEFTHPQDKKIYDGAITSPNQYFERAWAHGRQSAT